MQPLLLVLVQCLVCLVHWSDDLCVILQGLSPASHFTHLCSILFLSVRLLYFFIHKGLESLKCTRMPHTLSPGGPVLPGGPGGPSMYPVGRPLLSGMITPADRTASPLSPLSPLPP